MAMPTPHSALRTPQLKRLVPLLLDWFAVNARDLPWRRTRDPYAIWVSEIMLQQTQVKTVIPFWERWMCELPTIESVAKASPAKIHKLWEGLGYYTRARNLQQAAKQIVERGMRSAECGKTTFPDEFEEVLALPGIGRYTAGAICSIAYNQPTPILDGNVIRVLTRVFGIAENPKEKKTNARLWKLAEELVSRASEFRWGERPREPSSIARSARGDARLTENRNCSHLNQSLMELGALVCTPRSPQCRICPASTLCIAFQENQMEELPNLGKRLAVTARHFLAFVVERDGKFLVRQRPDGVVNGHLWEFPNAEIGARLSEPQQHPKLKTPADSSAVVLAKLLRVRDPRSIELSPLAIIKHSITRYRITLEAFHANLGGTSYVSPHSKQAKSRTRATRPSEHRSEIGLWKTPAQMRRLAFSSAHKKILTHLHP